jgi:hypothetical protein
MQGSQVQVRNPAVLEELLPEADIGTPLGATAEQVEPMVDDREEDDLEVIPARPDGFPRHRSKAVVPHDVSLLRCSVWLETKNKDLTQILFRLPTQPHGLLRPKARRTKASQLLPD